MGGCYLDKKLFGLMISHPCPFEWMISIAWWVAFNSSFLASSADKFNTMNLAISLGESNVAAIDLGKLGVDVRNLKTSSMRACFWLAFLTYGDMDVGPWRPGTVCFKRDPISHLLPNAIVIWIDFWESLRRTGTVMLKGQLNMRFSLGLFILLCDQELKVDHA